MRISSDPRRPSTLTQLATPALLLAAGALASVLGASTATASETDWPTFRGPNAQGVAEIGPLPTKIGPEQSLLWRTALPAGSSSPILWSDRIYLTGFEGDERLVFAVDTTGDVVWKKVAPHTRTEKLDNRNDPASPSAVADDEGIVVFFGDFGLIAYGHDGEEQWKKPLGPFRNIYGVGASPIIAGDLLVLSVDQQSGSFLLAVDRKTGDEKWNVARPEAKTGHSTPTLYQPEGGRAQLILPGSFFLTSYDLTTGEKVWWVRGLSFEMKSVAAIGEGHFFINGYGSQFNDPGQGVATKDWQKALAASDKDGNKRITAAELENDEFAHGWFAYNDLDGNGELIEEEWQYFRDSLATKNNMMAVKLPAADARGDLTESHVAWQHFRNVPQLPSPLLYQGVLWMISDRGIATTFEPATGKVISKGRIAGGAESYYASPVAADDKIWLAARSGLLSVMPPDGTLEPLHQVELDETITATPALAPGRLYVRTDEALWAFGAKEIE